MTDKLTPTPRTDELLMNGGVFNYTTGADHDCGCGQCVIIRHARQLERELAGMRGKVVEEVIERCAKEVEMVELIPPAGFASSRWNACALTQKLCAMTIRALSSKGGGE